MHWFGSKAWLNSWMTRYGLIGWPGSVALGCQAARQRSFSACNLGGDRGRGSRSWPNDVAACLRQLVENESSITQDRVLD